MTIADYQPYLGAAAVIFALLGITCILILRIRALDRKIDLLFRAAALHTRDLRANAGIAEKAYSDIRRADNHRRVLLASLNSRMTQIGAMLAGSDAPARTTGIPELQDAQPEWAEGETGRKALAGYRLAPRRRPRQTARIDTPEAAQQRKAVQIEEFFQRAGGFAGSNDGPGGLDEAREPRRAVNG